MTIVPHNCLDRSQVEMSCMTENHKPSRCKCTIRPILSRRAWFDPCCFAEAPSLMISVLWYIVGGPAHATAALFDLEKCMYTSGCIFSRCNIAVGGYRTIVRGRKVGDKGTW